MSWTQSNLKEQSRLKNFGNIIEKRKKIRKKSSFCVKFDLVRWGAGLHFIAKRLGMPSFFIKRSHLSNIRVKSEGLVASAWWVGVEWPISEIGRVLSFFRSPTRRKGATVWSPKNRVVDKVHLPWCHTIIATTARRAIHTLNETLSIRSLKLPSRSLNPNLDFMGSTLYSFTVLTIQSLFLCIAISVTPQHTKYISTSGWICICTLW